MRLQDKVAVVTGGASGFGAGIVRKFAEEGARVVVADLNVNGAHEIAAEVKRPWDTCRRRRWRFGGCDGGRDARCLWPFGHLGKQRRNHALPGTTGRSDRAGL